MGLLFWGASTYILTVSALPGATDQPNLSIQYFIYSIVGAIIIALAGIKISLNESFSDTKHKIKKGKKDKNKN